MRILSWISTVGFGLLAAGLLISLTWGYDSDRMTGVIVILCVIAFCRRITCARVVLRESVVTIVNPLMTYTVPYAAIAQVRGGGGTLSLLTYAGEEVLGMGYAGSVIDGFVRSADRAAQRIEERVKPKRRKPQEAPVVKKITVSWIADFCTVCAAVCLIVHWFAGT
ncbi:hypothetical protein [Streptomyces sp. WAC00469]|nr:hypothetical protein [Streptomyces sp. WAC00469]RSR97560.1 hypothetical protein EF917_22065 [Streptomyces sp. WAC00469]